MNSIDLTTVAAVNDWLDQASGTDSALIQTYITAFSQYALTYTGRRNLSSIKSYSETYNGSGSETLFLRNYPILSVSSLVIGTTAIPQSPGPTQSGWVIDTSGSQASLGLRGASGFQDGGFNRFTTGQRWAAHGNAPPLGYQAYLFTEGMQNVAVSYTAGYVIDALEVDPVPATGPYTVTVAQAGNFYADQGVTLADGTPLDAVASAPGPLQYVPPAFGVAPLGVYTFNSAQASASVNISYQYGGTPFDLAQAATQLTAAKYKSRGWIEQTSQMQPGVGTTAYSKLDIPADVKMVLDRYRARFLV
jgi:hypothetical protein